MWHDYSTAPKDGTRIMLWRGPSRIGKQAEMVIAEWRDGAWVWPDPIDCPSTHGVWTDEHIDFGYRDAGIDFTHWAHLPPGPAARITPTQEDDQ